MDEFRLGSRTLQPHRQLLAEGQHVHLGKRALDVLSVLADANGEIVTKDELLAAVWPGVIVEENALQVHIAALRKALGPEAERIKTIRGVGYQLTVDPRADPPWRQQMLEGAVAAVRPLQVERMVSPPQPYRVPKRSFRILALAASVLLLLVGAWFYAAPHLGLVPHERIALVVRPLTGSGSGNRTETGLANGITDELIVRLRQIPALRIATAEPNGSMPSESFRNAYVVDGSIRTSGEQLRVAARLLDSKGEILWSQTFDRPFADLFNVQEEIAAAIANALSVSFDVGGNSATYGGTNNPEAYAAYMQAYSHQLDPSFNGRPYLLRAVELDPQYAKARSALYGDYGLQISLVPTERKAAGLAELERNTREALLANPDSWIPEAARAMYDAYRHDFVSADRRFARVMTLDEGVDPELRSKTANFHMLLGRVRRAVALRRSNQLIDPIQRNDPFGIYDYEMLRQYQPSIQLYERLKKQAPQQGLGGFVLHAFWPRILMGREREAVAFTIGEGQKRWGDNYLAVKQDSALASLNRAQLRRWTEGRFGAGSEFDIAFAAMTASYSGNPKQAVELMRIAFATPSAGALWTLWHPAMDKARRTPEFRKLVTDLGLVKAWRASDDWGDFCRPLSTAEITCH